MKFLPVFAACAASVYGLKIKVSDEVAAPHQTRKDIPTATMSELKKLASKLSAEDAIDAVGAANLPIEIQEFLQGGRSLEEMNKYDPMTVITKLNAIFEDSQKQFDVQYVECKNSIDDLRFQMDRLAADKSQSGADMSADEAELAGWVAAKAETEDTIADLQEEKAKEQEECSRSKVQSEQLIALIKHDLEVVEDVIKTNKCNAKGDGPNNESAASTVTEEQLQDAAASFLQISQTDSVSALSRARAAMADLDELREIEVHGGASLDKPFYDITDKQRAFLEEHRHQALVRCTYPDGQSYLSFEAPEVARSMVQLSNKRYAALQSKLESLVQVEANTTPLPNYDTQTFQNANDGDIEARNLAKQIRNDQLAGKNVDKKTGATCSFAGSALCPEFYEKLGDLQADIADELQEEEDVASSTAKMCENRENQFNKDISSWNVYLAKANNRIPKVSSRIDDLKEIVKSLQKTYMDKLKEHDDRYTSCEESMAAAKSEMCGAVKVKTELMRMNGVPNEIWDCEVTPFQEGECSRKCEGGTKVWRRQVSVYPTPKYGTKCPPQTLKTDCNDFKCPQDCKEAPWTPWTRCNKECGIGESFRVREIEVEPAHGGQACGPRQEVKQCDMGECESECKLNKWTSWSKCTAFCGGGTQSRKKTVRVKATGGGYCPPERDHVRFVERACNERSCASGVMACKGKADILLVVDSSGSISSDYPKLTKAIRRFVSRVDLSANKLGIVEFSHKAVTVLKMSSNIGFVKKRATKLKFMGQNTSTDYALSRALIELEQGGRKATDSDVEQIIVVFTDGRPWRDEAKGVKKATLEITKQALDAGIKIVWVPFGSEIGDAFFTEVTELDSQSYTVPFREIDSLASSKGISSLITQVCSSAEVDANVDIEDDSTGTVTSTHTTNSQSSSAASPSSNNSQSSSAASPSSNNSQNAAAASKSNNSQNAAAASQGNGPPAAM